MPSTSSKVEVTVQQDPIPYWPEAPLPTGYWERPIYGQNREWYKIAGNWLFPTYNASYTPFGGFNPYTAAPNTAHIVWTRPIDFGGVIGGEYGTQQYYSGESYEGKFTPIIVHGRLFFNQRLSSSATAGLSCIDLRTGEQIWFIENMTVSFAQIYDYDSPNQHGGIPYLWNTGGSTWRMYDAFTGRLICSFANATVGGMFSPIGSKTTLGEDGSVIHYLLDGRNGWLCMWNSTKAVGFATSGPAAWMWRPGLGSTYDWKKGIEWNVTIANITGQSLNKIGSDILLTTTGSFSMADNVTYAAYSAKDGRHLWTKSYSISPGSNEGYFGSSNTQLLNGVFQRFTKSTLQFHGIDAYTGEEIWVTEPFTNAWGMYDETGCTAYDKFYTMAYDGMIHAYNLYTGEHLWDYYTGSSGFETPYGQWPFYVVNGWAIADGKIFAPTGEHSPDSPTWRGWKLHVVDAENGTQVWNVSGHWKNPAIADGYLVALNCYDTQLYCFGKGQTATTVNAPQTAVVKGTPIVISGTVTDQSPGKSKGTPAISDKDMTPWMEYIYMQQPKPTNATGVPVKLTAIDPNGNIHEIGTVTSDMMGNYAIMWTPPVPGLYKVIATFEGSESYFGSAAEAAFGVYEAQIPPQTAPLTTPSPTATPTSSPSVTVPPAGAFALPVEAVFAIAAIAIVVMITVAALLFRKRVK